VVGGHPRTDLDRKRILRHLVHLRYRIRSRDMYGLKHTVCHNTVRAERAWQWVEHHRVKRRRIR
jgi:hypothetical protein